MNQVKSEPAPPARALVIAAHPDDIEFVCAGTVAKWVRAGAVVRYVLATSGDAGTHQRGVTREDLARRREEEQRAAARTVGVDEVAFLGYRDGEVTPSLSLRRDLVREIRQFRPEIAICFDPTRLYVGGSYINHPDHRAVGQAALDALSPTAAMPLSFQEQVESEGLEPYRVRHIMIASAQHTDTWVDISDTIEVKVQALRKHVSQLDGRRDYEAMIRQWATSTGAEVGLRYAESFMQIVRPPDNER
ncbi:MAG: PIG-L family deacetylase [Anaerolineae bacterium]|nr:PIG-L family deacetylase [Anaerolineae bacterium]